MIVTKFAMKKNNRPQNNGKNRGYYQNIYDKYVNSAKECSVSGDKVMAEYNMQYAEHYLRLINERFPIEKKQQLKDDSNQTCTIQVSSDEEKVPEIVEEKISETIADTVQKDESSQPEVKKRRRCVKKQSKNVEIIQADSNG